MDNSALEKASIETDSNRNRNNNVLNAISIGIPLLGFLIGVWFSRPTLTTLVIFIIFFFMNVLGVGIGLHRYFVHRSFQTGPVIHTLLAIWGTWAFQGPIRRWVADHRRHHRYTDTEHDPHSPYWNDDGPIKSRMYGWLHSHVLWMLQGRMSLEGRYAADITDTSIAGWFSKYYWAIAATGLLLPTFFGWALNGMEEALACLTYAGFLRVVLLHNLTWSVNSFGHMFGSQELGAKDKSRNNIFLAILLLGEGLHSYHHKNPAHAINNPKHFDIAGWIILLADKVGLVKIVRKPV